MRASLLKIGILIVAGVAVWWVLTDLRVKTWPANVRSTYARGAIHHYFEVRCIAPTAVSLARRSGGLKIAGTYVGAYTGQAEDVSIWNVRAGDLAYPVMVSIFPDGEYAVTWWYRANDPTVSDSYVSSKLWDNSEATELRPISTQILESSGMPARKECYPRRVKTQVPASGSPTT